MLSVRLLETVRDVPKEAWNALVTDDASPFVDHRWLDGLEQTGCVGGESGWVPRHVAVFRGKDLVAASPLYVKLNSEGEFVFDWSWADLAGRLGLAYYPKLVVGVPFTPATGDRVLVAPSEVRGEMVALVAEAARAIAKSIDASSVHTLFPRPAEAAVWADAGYMARYGFQYQFHNRGFTAFDDFLKTLPSKKRTQIRREMSQPARDGMRIETVTPDAIDDRVVEAMFAFYVSTVSKYRWGRQYLTRGFFDWVVSHFRERLAWVVARDAAGGIVAGAFNVKGGKRLYGRYWGAREERPFLHFNVCYYHGIREAIADGLSVFEPGAGGEHKHARGFVPTLTHSAHWIADRRMSGLLERFLEREREAVVDHIREHGVAETAP